LANLLFTLELDRRAAAAGVSLVSVAAHPGVAHTNLASTGNPVRAMVIRLARMTAQRNNSGSL